MTDGIRGWLDQKLTRLGYALLRRSIRRDPSYAWSWQCNLAMAMFDSDHPHDASDHERANRGASLFMDRLFDVDTTKHPAWNCFEQQWRLDAAYRHSGESQQ